MVLQSLQHISKVHSYVQGISIYIVKSLKCKLGNS